MRVAAAPRALRAGLRPLPDRGRGRAGRVGGPRARRRRPAPPRRDRRRRRRPARARADPRLAARRADPGHDDSRDAAAARGGRPAGRGDHGRPLAHLGHAGDRPPPDRERRPDHGRPRRRLVRGRPRRARPPGRGSRPDRGADAGAARRGLERRLGRRDLRRPGRSGVVLGARRRRGGPPRARGDRSARAPRAAGR